MFHLESTRSLFSTRTVSKMISSTLMIVITKLCYAGTRECVYSAEPLIIFFKIYLALRCILSCTIFGYLDLFVVFSSLQHFSKLYDQFPIAEIFFSDNVNKEFIKTTSIFNAIEPLLTLEPLRVTSVYFLSTLSLLNQTLRSREERK